MDKVSCITLAGAIEEEENLAAKLKTLCIIEGKDRQELFDNQKEIFGLIVHYIGLEIGIGKLCGQVQDIVDKESEKASQVDPLIDFCRATECPMSKREYPDGRTWCSGEGFDIIQNIETMCECILHADVLGLNYYFLVDILSDMIYNKARTIKHLYRSVLKLEELGEYAS